MNPVANDSPRVGPLRADARRNIEGILRAAVACLGADPGSTAGEIAQAAGVGRVTLYGHFPSRAQLVEAALVQVLEDGDVALEAMDLDSDPRTALRALIEASWQLTAQASSILTAAVGELPPERIRELHAKPERRVTALIERGQREGSFRTDIPATWLASTMHHLMKGAAADVATDRLDPQDAGAFIAAVVLGAFSPPILDVGIRQKTRAKDARPIPAP